MSQKHAKSFHSVNLSEPLVRVINELGFEAMTPIQAEAIPPLIAGEDVVGQSATGSGKTAAFGLPILQNIVVEKRRIQALIICPTRELCSQVAKQIRTLGRRYPNLQVVTITGGQKIYQQTFALKKGVHIVVGTPGRLVDHLSRGNLDLRAVKTLVLDEADRMLDMGFEEDMTHIIAATPKERQTALFSATIPSSLEKMLQKALRNPKFIKIDDTEKPPEIEEKFFLTPRERKADLFLEILLQEKPESAIVFCNFKATVKELNRKMQANQISAAALHGDLEQMDRDREMAKFKNRSTRVLIATDVAARGIDVQDLDLVVNFDLPNQPETYVHRIGRTARAGKQGKAVSLLTDKEKFKLADIEKQTGKTLSPERPKPLETTATPLPSQMKTLYISAGRKNKVRAGDLLGALTGDAGGLACEQIGKIDIGDYFSYVAVKSDVAKVALAGLQRGKIKGKKFRIEFAR